MNNFYTEAKLQSSLENTKNSKFNTWRWGRKKDFLSLSSKCHTPHSTLVTYISLHLLTPTWSKKLGIACTLGRQFFCAKYSFLEQRSKENQNIFYSFIHLLISVHFPPEVLGFTVFSFLKSGRPFIFCSLLSFPFCLFFPLFFQSAM